jgi:hypothetical protein
VGAVKEGASLFYVRPLPCADGSFEWYVLNGHTGRRASETFKTKAAAEARRSKLQANIDLAKVKSSDECRKVER